MDKNCTITFYLALRGFMQFGQEVFTRLASNVAVLGSEMRASSLPDHESPKTLLSADPKTWPERVNQSFKFLLRSCDEEAAQTAEDCECDSPRGLVAYSMGFPTLVDHITERVHHYKRIDLFSPALYLWWPARISLRVLNWVDTWTFGILTFWTYFVWLPTYFGVPGASDFGVNQSSENESKTYEYLPLRLAMKLPSFMDEQQRILEASATALRLEMKRTGTKVRIFCGAKDMILPQSSFRRLAEILDAELIVFDDLGHDTLVRGWDTVKPKLMKTLATEC